MIRERIRKGKGIKVRGGSGGGKGCRNNKIQKIIANKT